MPLHSLEFARMGARIEARLAGVWRKRWRGVPLRLVALALLLLAAGAGLAVAGYGHLRRAQLLRADPDALAGSDGLARWAAARGRGVFAHQCAACHGAAGGGDQRFGVPDLTDSIHIYGSGSVSETEQIVRYGIRSHHSRGWNLASMPGFGTPRPAADPVILPLSPGQIDDLTQFVLGFTGRAGDAAAVARGRALFAGQGGCYDCHGTDGSGDAAIGAPSLRGMVWIYGGSPAAIRASITYGRAGASPAFAGRLDPADIRAVAFYVATLSRQERSDAGE